MDWSSVVSILPLMTRFIFSSTRGFNRPFPLSIPITFYITKNDPLFSSSPLWHRANDGLGGVGRSDGWRWRFDGWSRVGLGRQWGMLFTLCLGQSLLSLGFFALGSFFFLFFFIFHPSSPSIDALSGLGVVNSLHFELIVVFLPSIDVLCFFISQFFFWAFGFLGSGYFGLVVCVCWGLGFGFNWVRVGLGWVDRRVQPSGGLCWIGFGWVLGLNWFSLIMQPDSINSVLINLIINSALRWLMYALGSCLFFFSLVQLFKFAITVAIWFCFFNWFFIKYHLALIKFSVHVAGWHALILTSSVDIFFPGLHRLSHCPRSFIKFFFPVLYVLSPACVSCFFFPSGSFFFLPFLFSAFLCISYVVHLQYTVFLSSDSGIPFTKPSVNHLWPYFWG